MVGRGIYVKELLNKKMKLFTVSFQKYCKSTYYCPDLLKCDELEHFDCFTFLHTLRTYSQPAL